MNIRYLKNTLSEMLRILLPLLILAVGVVVCFILYEMRLSPSEHVAEKVEPPTVETVPILPKTGGFEIVLGGEVVPYREIEVAAEVCGRIVGDDVRSGHFAKKGDLLLEIDPTNYDLDVRRLTEEVRQAEIRLEENSVETNNVQKLIELAKTEHSLQVKERNRISELVRSRAVSESEHDTAERQVVVALRSLVELENQSSLLKQKNADLRSTLEQTKTLLARAEEDTKRCRIFAPCDGVVVRDNTEPGNYVSVGQSLFVFEDVTKVEVKCQLQAKELYWLWMQQTGKGTENDPQRTCYEIPESDVSVSWTIEGRTWHWRGKLSRYDGHGINAATRTIPVRVEISDPRNTFLSESSHEISPPALTRGIYVTASIHADPGIQLWQVPTAGIRGGNKIYIAEKERLEIHDVQVVQRNKDFSVIRLLSNEPSPSLCVVSPLACPQNGMSIRILAGATKNDTSMASLQTGGRR